MPGETIPKLRQELIDRKVEMELDRSKMYCFDSEPFQFLACVQAGIKFPDEDFEVFSAGWSKAVREQDRMFEHIGSLKPRLSLENIRRQVLPMTCSLTEMGVAMQEKIREVKEAEVKAKLAESQAAQSRPRAGRLAAQPNRSLPPSMYGNGTTSPPCGRPNPGTG